MVRYSIEVRLHVDVEAETEEEAIEKATDVALGGDGGDAAVYDTEIMSEQEV